MVLALGVIGIWFGLGAVALCACVLGSRMEQLRPVRKPVVNETTHPGRMAA